MYSHLTLGNVTKDNIEFIQAEAACDLAIYGDGVEVFGRTVTTDQQADNAFRSASSTNLIVSSKLGNNNPARERNDQIFSDKLRAYFNIGKSHQKCLETRGFTYIKTSDR